MMLNDITTKHPESYRNHYKNNNQDYFYNQINLINADNGSYYDTDEDIEKYLINERDISIINIRLIITLETPQKQGGKQES